MGNREANLAAASAMIHRRCGSVLQHSSLYETAAWGLEDQPDFLNQVIKLNTLQEPRKLMQSILDIELQLGRVRQEKYGPRIIDIDILFFDDLVLDEPHLTIPHPRIPERRFVLEPLHEIAPGFLHPVFHQTIHQLLLNCPDLLEVKLQQ